MARIAKKTALLVTTGAVAASLAIAVPAATADGGGKSRAEAAQNHGKPGKPTPPKKLKILLSNDDGYRSPLIRAMQKALQAAGHEAVIVAPAGDQSGKGTGINASPGSQMKAFQAEPGIWAVEGTPGDSVQFGIANVFTGGKPDLVVSGVNFGQNVGPSTNHSGTVGATVAANDKGIPGIAISAEYNVKDPSNLFPSGPQAAAFVVPLVQKLIDTAGRGPLLPPHTALNVNFPIKPNGKIAFTNVGQADNIVTKYVPDPASCATCYKVDLGLDANAQEPVQNADTTALSKSQVSISLLTGDWTAFGWQWGQPLNMIDVQTLKWRLGDLKVK
jgi:5'/3'-nucleotidase SurE